MAATLLSRATGLAREVIAAALFGVGGEMSAFTVALQLPVIIRASIADTALISAFVPVFTELLEQNETERAWRVASTILSVIVLVMLPATLLAMWEAPRIVELVVHDQFGQQGLAAILFRILIPIVMLMSLAGVITGILNAYGHFSVPAFAPVASNLLIIVIVLWGIEHVSAGGRIYVYALAFVGGTLLQLLMPLPWLQDRGGRLGFIFAAKDPAVKAILSMMLPVMLTLFFIEISPVINTYFSTGVPLSLLKKDSGPAVLDKALKVFQVAQGVFSMAVAAVFFPIFARCQARDDKSAFRLAFADGLRQLFILLLPSAALMFFLAEPIVRVLYERGAWDPAQTPVVASALRGFSLGLASNGGFLLLTRAFFSLRKPWIPASIGFVNCLANALFAWLLVQRGVAGIALATGVANTLAFAWLYYLLGKRLGRLPDRTIWAGFGATVVLSVASASFGLGLVRFSSALIGSGKAFQAFLLAVAVLLTYSVHLTLAARLGLMSRGTIGALLRRDTV